METKNNLIWLIVPIFLFSQLLGREWNIELHKGWQLIGLPIETNKRIFNNEHVRLVWIYSGQYREWLGYSPDKNLQNKLSEEVASIYELKPWQGVWVQSIDDWNLTISDYTDFDNPKIVNKLHLYEGWNLVSLPFDTTLFPEVFDEKYTIWKYDKYYYWAGNKFKFKKDIQWQTNRRDNIVEFPPISEINSLTGFWIYSPTDEEIDISNLETKLLSNRDLDVSSIDEVEHFIGTNLLVSNRNSKYWNWELIDTNKEQGKRSNIVENGVTNTTPPNTKFGGVETPTIFKRYGEYIFYKTTQNSKDTVAVAQIDSILNGGNIGATFFTPSISGNVDTISIDNFIVSNNTLVIFSSIKIDSESPNFANRCRSNRTLVSIYSLAFNPVDVKSGKHIIIDGEITNSQVIENNLYFVTKFQPCIDIEYPKIYLSNLDKCNYPSDDIDYKLNCSDVYSDSKGRFRFDYDKPIVQHLYTLPKYQYGDSNQLLNLIDPNHFYATPKLDMNSSIFTLSHVNFQSNELLQRYSIFGDFKTYFAKSNLYLISNYGGEYISFRDKKTKSSIYKFAFYPHMEYRGMGEVEGEIASPLWLSEPKSDSSMVRIASKDRWSWKESRENRISILQDVNNSLIQIGKVSNIVDERLQLGGVKFFGDIAIASSDTQSDNFKLIDLKDSSDPKEGGIFSIKDGKNKFIYYSENDNRIITINRKVDKTDYDDSLNISLFDTSNLNDPKYIGGVDIGDFHNNTPVVSNPDSFVYLDSDRVLALPIYTDGTQSDKTAQSGLYLFDVVPFQSGYISLEPQYRNNPLRVASLSKFSKNHNVLPIYRGYQMYLVYLIDGKLTTTKVLRNETK